MAKCLRCGAGNEWIQGEVKKEPATEALAYKGGEQEVYIRITKDQVPKNWADFTEPYYIYDGRENVWLKKTTIHQCDASYKAGEDLEPDKI